MTTARHILKSHRVLAGIVAVLAIVAGDRLISLSTQPELSRYSFVVNIEGKILPAEPSEDCPADPITQTSS